MVTLNNQLVKNSSVKYDDTIEPKNSYKILNCFCHIYAGSFSRTAVNFSAGCETIVSNIVMAITVFLSLELFTRLLYYTPIAILASIILSALPGLIDVHEAYYIWKVDKLDFMACIGAFFGVLFASVEIGLLVAVITSLHLFFTSRKSNLDVCIFNHVGLPRIIWHYP